MDSRAVTGLERPALVTYAEARVLSVFLPLTNFDIFFLVQYVKMVHNGIEVSWGFFLFGAARFQRRAWGADVLNPSAAQYGDMQLIAETYDILKRGLGLKEAEIADGTLPANAFPFVASR